MIAFLAHTFNQIILSQIIILFFLPFIVTFFKVIKSLNFLEFYFILFIQNLIFMESQRKVLSKNYNKKCWRFQPIF